MAKNTISMSRFRANLTKISRLAKSGYNSITSVAKQIISTVTAIASKISVLNPNSAWQGASEQALPAEDYKSYYDEVLKAEEKFLNTSLSNLTNYKDEIIRDIFTVGDALTHNTDQIYFGLEEALRREFDEIKEDFFTYGKVGGTNFGNGLKESISACVDEVQRLVNASMDKISSGVLATGGSTSYSSITYSNPSYNFYSSKQTVSQQLSEARKEQAISAMRRP